MDLDLSLAGDRRALHESLVACGVVGRPSVQHAPVVPDHEIALRPLMTVAELRLGDVLQQLLQQRAAFLERQTLDVRGVGAEQERAAAVDRVGAHNRMAHGRERGALLIGEEAGAHLVARPREVVDGDRALHARLQRRRQRRIGGPRAGELRGAALRRHDARGQQRAERRHRLEGAVAVPEHVGELVDHPAIVGRNDLSGLHVEVRLPRERRPRRRVHAARDLEIAEPPAEGDLPLVVQRLAVEDQNRVLLEGGADHRPARLVEGPGEVGALDPRGKDRCQAGHRDRHAPSDRAG